MVLDTGRGRWFKRGCSASHFSRLNLTTRSPQRRDFFSPVHTVTAPTTLSMCEGPRREAHQSAARGRESAIRWTPDIRFRVAPAPLRERLHLQQGLREGLEDRLLVQGHSPLHLRWLREVGWFVGLFSLGLFFLGMASKPHRRCWGEVPATVRRCSPKVPGKAGPSD